MDANGLRNMVHQQLEADDSLVVTTVLATVDAIELIVEIGDRGHSVTDDQFEVTIWQRDREVDRFIAAAPDADSAIRNAWSKAKSRINWTR